MSSKDLPPFLLQELPDITEIVNCPLNNTQRIKYSCFDVSKTLIAFGATSGGIYIFNRQPCEFTQLIPNKDGAITRLAISPDEKHIAIANGRGIVNVCSYEQDSGHSSICSKEHQGNEITAIVWGLNNLFIGDDVGKVSVLQLPNFITKTIFPTAAQAIMNLDSRICQLDIKDCMLLVSTLTRCYICDTQKEHYRQIGQKLRDGEFGACFVTTSKFLENGALDTIKQDYMEFKKYEVVNNEESFVVNKKLANVLIYCARPSSRLWEASINGTVVRTHQFKQVLAKTAAKVISPLSYDKENVSIDPISTLTEGHSCSFLKIYNFNDGVVFCYTKNAVYFLNTNNVDNTIWFDINKGIISCSMFKNFLYLWLSDGSIISLMFMNIEKYLLKCYLDQKFVLCGNMCALYKNHLLSSDLSNKLHILVGLKEKLKNNKELLEKISTVLIKFESLQYNGASQTRSGIYVVDNSYNNLLSDEDFDEEVTENDNRYSKVSPEAIQTIKEIGSTVSDKLSTSKKILKEKWESVEEKMKHLQLSNDKTLFEQNAMDFSIQERNCHDKNNIVELTPFEKDIVFKDSSQKSVHISDDNDRSNTVLRSLYQCYRLSSVNKEKTVSNLISVIENYSCDIKEIYKLMLDLEQYCISIGLGEEASSIVSNVFLNYVNSSQSKNDTLDVIITDEVLYKYFINCCICVNLKTQKLMNLACDCGFPLPYIRTYQSPEFSDLIDAFVEKQWSMEPKSSCYEICRQMPFLWRKILYLRRNEDLMKILRILLQMLDESLLRNFLPQFTLDTWDAAIKLYATLHANICLNCGKKFENVIVKDTLSWDDLGALMIKSIGGTNAIKMMEKYAELIGIGEITMKFYHTCLLVCLYERCDNSITCKMTDTLYSAYAYEDARNEILNLLRNITNGTIKNTSLPVIVAAQSPNWGMSLCCTQSSENLTEDSLLTTSRENSETQKSITLQEILDDFNNTQRDCSLCGLPLMNEVLIKDSGLWVFECGHVFHGACLDIHRVKLCPSCTFK